MNDFDGRIVNDGVHNYNHGFSLPTLNNCEFKFEDEMNEEIDLHHNIECNIVESSNLDQIDTSNNLSMLCFNIRSMFKNFNNFKVEILESEVSYDVIGLCESRLTDESECLYMMDNYNFFSNNISSSKGGVCLFIKNNIKCKLRSDLTIKEEHLETIFVECVINGKQIVIGMLYRRPSSPVNLFLEEITTLMSKINQNCVLMGDMNLNLLNFDSDNNVRLFVNTMKEFMYFPVITKPTRVQNASANLLDHIWINFNHFNYHNSYIIFSCITDHFPVVYNYELNRTLEQYKTIKFRVSGEQCDEKFKTSEELSQHTKNHLKLISGHNNLNIQSNIEEPVPNEEKCKICGKGFATNDELNNHIKEHLNMIGGKNNLNIQSKKNQSIQDDESSVEQTDTLDKPNSSENEEEDMSLPNYTCDFCDKTFNQNKNLTLHKKEIHGITTSKDCKQCGKQFNRLDKLKLHILSVHDKRKDFHCSECNKSFSRSDKLSRHVRIVHES